MVKENGKRLITPMFLVILALGTTDLLFALDSIPAIYGLTQEPYLVLTANIFALMGLRQLYFLIGGLLQRLIYLSYGLAVLLGFIGVKLILHAMHENELPFINGGEHIEWAPDIPTLMSLGIIIGILGVTTVASLVASARGVEGKSSLASAMDEPDEAARTSERRARRPGPGHLRGRRPGRQVVSPGPGTGTDLGRPEGGDAQIDGDCGRVQRPRGSRAGRPAGLLAHDER